MNKKEIKWMEDKWSLTDQTFSIYWMDISENEESWIENDDWIKNILIDTLNENFDRWVYQKLLEESLDLFSSHVSDIKSSYWNLDILELATDSLSNDLTILNKLISYETYFNRYTPSMLVNLMEDMMYLSEWLKSSPGELKEKNDNLINQINQMRNKI